MQTHGIWLFKAAPHCDSRVYAWVLRKLQTTALGPLRADSLKGSSFDLNYNEQTAAGVNLATYAPAWDNKASSMLASSGVSATFWTDT